MDDQFPSINIVLLQKLEEQFPELSPSKGETYEDLLWRGGQRDIIRFLRSKFEEQNDNILDRTIT